VQHVCQFAAVRVASEEGKGTVFQSHFVGFWGVLFQGRKEVFKGETKSATLVPPSQLPE
jgi:hypothetical protein